MLLSVLDCTQGATMGVLVSLSACNLLQGGCSTDDHVPQARKGGQPVQLLDVRNCTALADDDVACICHWFPHLQYAPVPRGALPSLGNAGECHDEDCKRTAGGACIIGSHASSQEAVCQLYAVQCVAFMSEAIKSLHNTFITF